MDLARVGRVHVGLVGATGSVAYAAHWGEPMSLVLGGAIMGANFWALRWMTALLCRSAVRPQRQASVALGVFGMTMKFGLFLALLGALFTRLPIDAMSFAVGVTLLLVACVIEAVRAERVREKGGS
jgi:hypothetical protein